MYFRVTGAPVSYHGQQRVVRMRIAYSGSSQGSVLASGLGPSCFNENLVLGLIEMRVTELESVCLDGWMDGRWTGAWCLEQKKLDQIQIRI